MKVFIDTSSLFKLYNNENDTHSIENLFASNTITHIYLSEITKIEFVSAILKKVRTKEITISEANTTISLFENDCKKFIFETIDGSIIEKSKNLVLKYGLNGLRTLDSVQAACALALASEVQLFITSDNLLKSIFEAEGLKTN